MSGGHVHAALGVEAVAAGDSLVHRLDPRAKIVGLIGVAVVAVTTPVGAWWAYTAYGAILVLLALLARLPVRHVLARMTVEVPFLVAAAVLPLTRDGGAVLGGTLAAKATVGVLAMILLSSTTPFPRLLTGFESLRAPRLLLMIVSFMWRYAHVLADEVRRMRIARQARGERARWLWQAAAIGASVATLFVRALERGERVYLAMASRGYTGGIPATVGVPLVVGRADVAFCALLATALVLVRLRMTG